MRRSTHSAPRDRRGRDDNGAPGGREIYRPNHYGRHLLDPDGTNIEAVCHQPTEPA